LPALVWLITFEIQILSASVLSFRAVVRLHQAIINGELQQNAKVSATRDGGGGMLPLILAIYAGPEEEALIARLQRRDPQALAKLYDDYGRAAYALVLRVVRDRAIAEDLVQETFLRVWNRVHLIDSQKGALGAWLLAIARNRAIDYLRSSAGRERNAIELNETDHAPLYREMEAEILISDQARRVRDAMARLAPNYRTVMELAYFEGLSQAEMSVKMGQPLGTIKTWVRTALQSLRSELGVAVPS
jgi:RNA polymerase sigma-70 factor (ECF subfamily)